MGRVLGGSDDVGGAGWTRLKRRKNGQSSRADVRSIGPSALDREIGAVQSCALSHWISHGLRGVPQVWQCHENTSSRTHRPLSMVAQDRPRS